MVYHTWYRRPILLHFDLDPFDFISDDIRTYVVLCLLTRSETPIAKYLTDLRKVDGAFARNVLHICIGIDVFNST